MDVGPVQERDRTAEYILVASVAIAAYDYVMTLPAEWSIYRAQCSRVNISINCVLFIAIRYTSIVLICVSSYNLLYPGFSSSTCRHWYMAPEALKVVQAMVAQAIVAWRVYVVSRRKPAVKWFIIGFYVVACAGEWVTNLLHRHMTVDHGHCRTPNNARIRTAWLFYLIASIYDVITLSIIVLYLNRVHAKSYLMSRLKKILIYHGLVNFFVILAGNLLNMIIYLSNTNLFQFAAAPICYTLTWIFAQKLLIHIHELALSEKIREGSTGVRSVTVTITRSTDVAEEISRAVQTSYDALDDCLEMDIRIRTHGQTIPSINSQISKDV